MEFGIVFILIMSYFQVPKTAWERRARYEGKIFVLSKSSLSYLERFFFSFLSKFLIIRKTTFLGVVRTIPNI